jgi:glycosyltransferase involved in cell wall biosynthesis
MATLNAAETLPRALASIRRYAEGAELIVIDGGSADATLDILQANREYISHLVSEPDDGIYNALNKGLDLATRPWFYVMGADDELLEGFSLVLGELEDPTRFYYGRIWLRQQARPSSGGEYNDRRFLRSWPNHQALIAPTSAMRSIGGFDQRYRLAADWAVHIKLWQRGLKWQYVHHIYCSFSEGGEGVAAGPDKRFRRDKLWLAVRYLSSRAVIAHMLDGARTTMSRIGVGACSR